MTLSIRRVIRVGLVLGVSLVTTVVLTLPAPAGSASTQCWGHNPSPRRGQGMAYDAARGQVVLFGGYHYPGPEQIGGTWTWDGTRWTRRLPAHSPSRRMVGGAMAYDATRGQVVLFGGFWPYFDDTWTWDGTDWSLQHPAHSPPGHGYSAMAYDAARGQVVLFGGYNGSYLNDTWTWDGTDWTQQSPVHVPTPRWGISLAYDAARSEVVLFGGNTPSDQPLHDTWTWNGTDWTLRHPTHSPPGRAGNGLAYDDVRGEVVLFGGGVYGGRFFGDTWTWDGADWTKQSPLHLPLPRVSMGLAYDSALGRAVLFGGMGKTADLNDTWTWDGVDWSLELSGSIGVRPQTGSPGTIVTVRASGFAARERVRIVFVDSVQGGRLLGSVKTDPSGWAATRSTISAQPTGPLSARGACPPLRSP